MQKLRVAAVSTRNRIGRPDVNIRNMSRWAHKAADLGVDLVVFPELSVSGYVLNVRVWDVAETVPGPSTDSLIALARNLGLMICYGIAERHADITYNSQVIVSGDGIVGMQRKIHMPGEEYLYWRGGFEINTIDIGKARAGIAICYDALYPEMARTLFFKGAEILIMPFAYWSKIPRSRFIEDDITGLSYRTACYSNGFYGILCNNAGRRRRSGWEKKGAKFPGWAGVIGPEGEVVAFTRGPGIGEDMVVADLDPAAIAKRRRDTYFMPRCLRPELYLEINSPAPCP